MSYLRVREDTLHVETKPNWLILFTQIIFLYLGINPKGKNTLSPKYADFSDVKAGGI